MRLTRGYGLLTAMLLPLCASAVGSGSSVTDEFTFSCVPLTRQLSDPIVSPGVRSAHTHIVAGGTAFQRTMTIDTAKNANETTCGVEIDRSNYWIPQLYHRMKNGSFELIEFEGNVGFPISGALPWPLQLFQDGSQRSRPFTISTEFAIILRARQSATLSTLHWRHLLGFA